MRKLGAVARLLLLVPIAYLSAAVVAALIVLVAMLGGISIPTAGGIYVVVMLFITAWIFAATAAAAALVAVVAAEVFGWRHWLFWVALGCLIGVVMTQPLIEPYTEWLSSIHVIPTHHPGYAVDRMLRNDLIAVAALAGGSAGLSFWAMAGRYAGTGWRRRAVEPIRR